MDIVFLYTAVILSLCQILRNGIAGSKEMYTYKTFAMYCFIVLLEGASTSTPTSNLVLTFKSIL